ncbi:MAG: hypothetical protein CME38_12155 [Haliea sp.]|nr:hypothetical protein [Haliea sp.]|tara:strand:- start:255 stop:641 length:387 start_codon:yes stop_codon:yes gene_type:complete
MKDLNRIAKIEQAIAKKYGAEAIDNPRKYWDDEKEKSYQEQIKEIAEKERIHQESEEKEEVDGVLISKKLLNRETTRRDCPVCETYSFNLKDDAYMNKYDCCYNCFVQWVDGREDRWSTGWRPPKGDE